MRFFIKNAEVKIGDVINVKTIVTTKDKKASSEVNETAELTDSMMNLFIKQGIVTTDVDSFNMSKLFNFIVHKDLGNKKATKEAKSLIISHYAYLCMKDKVAAFKLLMRYAAMFFESKYKDSDVTDGTISAYFCDPVTSEVCCTAGKCNYKGAFSCEKVGYFRCFEEFKKAWIEVANYVDTANEICK